MTRELEVWRSADRFVTTHPDGITTRHLLSFGSHYDERRVAIGPMVAHNDEWLPPGRGFSDHRHRGVEIVTWVVGGRLRHRDSLGGDHVVDAYGAQVLNPGNGIIHAESNAEQAEDAPPVRFIQTWLRPDAGGAAAAYQASQFDSQDLSAAFVPVAAGPGMDESGALPLGRAGAVLLAGLVESGADRQVASAAHVHLFVAEGAVRVAGEDVHHLGAGDSLVVRGPGESLSMVAEQASSVLVWLLPEAER